ncbi:Rho GTPase activation protein [Auriscalpium vulgare]|uniref:Rho GTPase activation protein n=1 Tax=Auriscalpium vulgare TaxID=40419 RepID=A0ACB8RKX8_9AGAM|nr:Rho GTPase activation protein [Auriscalpium vulgare]
MTAEHRDAKAGLRTWWQHFTTAQKMKPRELGKGGAQTVFGTPLRESLRYASVQISTANANGELYVWGYIPVVVAKCGLFLKENATEVEGTFRVNGSNKRMRDLQAIFEAPPRYGKSIDWKKENYTTHDVASVFRRYLTQMPEPVIPHDLYHQFRDAIAKKPYNQDEVIATYKRLIHSMPHANQYLLLYVLDLLSVFARKSDKNLMTAQNLAVIFRPGLISHPTHEMSPPEHQLSQEVLEFLIAHQDWFMLDIPPPPASYSRHSQQAPPRGATAGRPRPTQDEDIVVMSSSDEEATGGWKLVASPGRSTSPAGSKVGRRRTTTERERAQRHGEAPLSTRHLSPVAEKPPARAHIEAPGVTRSRTLPQRTSRKDKDKAVKDRGAQSGDEQVARLLRKGRRASAQPDVARRPPAGAKGAS